MKLLYDTSTQLFKPYPRSDDEEVVGLDPIYQVYSVIQNDPPLYNPATHHLQPVQSIDHGAREVIRFWAVLANPPMPAPAPTMRSFHLACGKALWENIEAVVNAIPDDNEKWQAQQYLEYSPTVLRNHPLVHQLATALQLSSAEVDAVFAAAQVIDDTP